MSKIIKMNPYMFELLIEKKMDDFSVPEIRDELMNLEKSFTDKEEARKFVYKQLLAFEKRGWLVTVGTHRQKRYLLTDQFREQSFTPRVREKSSTQGLIAISERRVNFDTLWKEKKQYEGELAIALGEIEEYQSLLQRFPNDKASITPLFDAAKERSAKLLGKINALTNWLNLSDIKALAC